jgi:hypothetical protein
MPMKNLPQDATPSMNRASASGECLLSAPSAAGSRRPSRAEGSRRRESPVILAYYASTGGGASHVFPRPAAQLDPRSRSAGGLLRVFPWPAAQLDRRSRSAGGLLRVFSLARSATGPAIVLCGGLLRVLPLPAAQLDRRSCSAAGLLYVFSLPAGQLDRRSRSAGGPACIPAGRSTTGRAIVLRGGAPPSIPPAAAPLHPRSCSAATGLRVFPLPAVQPDPRSRSTARRSCSPGGRGCTSDL